VHALSRQGRVYEAGIANRIPKRTPTLAVMPYDSEQWLFGRVRLCIRLRPFSIVSNVFSFINQSIQQSIPSREIQKIFRFNSITLQALINSRKNINTINNPTLTQHTNLFHKMFFRSSNKMTSDAASTSSSSTMNSFKHLLHRNQKVLSESERVAKQQRAVRLQKERMLTTEATFAYFTTNR
jgi:hypothetical protein